MIQSGKTCKKHLKRPIGPKWQNVKNSCGGKLFLSKDAGHWPETLLKIAIIQMIFIYFAFMALFLYNRLERNGLMTINMVDGVEP